MGQLKFYLFLRKTDVLLTPNNHYFFYLIQLFKIYRAIGVYVCFEVPCFFEVHILVMNENQFVKGKGFLEVGTRSLAALATFRFDTRLIFMSWQPE